MGQKLDTPDLNHVLFRGSDLALLLGRVGICAVLEALSCPCLVFRFGEWFEKSEANWAMYPTQKEPYYDGSPKKGRNIDELLHG